MFHIIDRLTGNRLVDRAMTVQEVTAWLTSDLPLGYTAHDIFVRADCESGFGLNGAVWMGIE